MLERSKGFLLLGALALLSVPILFWWSRNFQSQAELKMLFWQAEGKVKIPTELSSEASMREVLLSSALRERVNRRLSRQLSESDYSQALDLSSNRHDWNPRREIIFRVLAVGNSPERSMRLCNVASEELSKYAQELAQEFEQQLWDLEILKVQSALGQWNYQNRAKPPTTEDVQRLKLSIAATQMNLRDLKDNPHSGSSEASRRVTELKEGLEDLQTALDELWLRGARGEAVKDLEKEWRDRQVQLQEAIGSNQSALLNEAKSLLERLKKQESQWSTQASVQALDQLTELRTSLGTLTSAKDFAAMQMSMYCLVYRPASEGRLLATHLRELSPSLFALFLAAFCLWSYKRQDTEIR